MKDESRFLCAFSPFPPPALPQAGAARYLPSYHKSTSHSLSLFPFLSSHFPISRFPSLSSFPPSFSLSPSPLSSIAQLLIPNIFQRRRLEQKRERKLASIPTLISSLSTTLMPKYGVSTRGLSLSLSLVLSFSPSISLF